MFCALANISASTSMWRLHEIHANWNRQCAKSRSQNRRARKSQSGRSLARSSVRWKSIARNQQWENTNRNRRREIDCKKLRMTTTTQIRTIGEKSQADDGSMLKIGECISSNRVWCGREQPVINRTTWFSVGAVRKKHNRHSRSHKNGLIKKERESIKLNNNN